MLSALTVPWTWVNAESWKSNIWIFYTAYRFLPKRLVRKCWMCTDRRNPITHDPCKGQAPRKCTRLWANFTLWPNCVTTTSGFIKWCHWAPKDFLERDVYKSVDKVFWTSQPEKWLVSLWGFDPFGLITSLKSWRAARSNHFIPFQIMLEVSHLA